MRLLYLHHVPLSSGRANVIQVLQMCRALQGSGIEVRLAVPASGKGESDVMATAEEELGERVEFSIISYPRYTLRGRLATLGCCLGIRSVLRSSSDADYCFVRNPLFNRMAIQGGLKTMFEAHEAVLHPSSMAMHRWYSRMLLSDVKSPKFVRFVAISKALADLWGGRGVSSDKITVLHDGVAARDYRAPLEQRAARERLGLDAYKKIVVYAGSLYGDRDIESILRLARSIPDAHFLVVGGPEERKLRYAKTVGDQGLRNLTFAGRVPHRQVREYLFAADVLLMLWSWQVPTIEICSPLKVFEYMAAGRVIVGYAFPTIEEVLSNGETALLASPGNYPELERNLREALGVTYPNGLAQKARETALSRYTWESRAKSIVEILSQN